MLDKSNIYNCIKDLYANGAFERIVKIHNKDKRDELIHTSLEKLMTNLNWFDKAINLEASIIQLFTLKSKFDTNTKRNNLESKQVLDNEREVESFDNSNNEIDWSKIDLKESHINILKKVDLTPSRVKTILRKVSDNNKTKMIEAITIYLKEQ